MKNYYVLLLVLLSHVAYSQKSVKDSVVELKPVVVSSERLRDMSIGHKVENIDSLTLSKYSSSNISDLLFMQTPIYLKTYGIGSVSDMSIRGTTAQQNAIFWNGFNINTSSNGLTDLALLPVSFFNNIDILYGGGSSIYGNGIVGGSLHLINTPKFIKNKSIDINASAGSFGNYNMNVKEEISDTKMTSLTAFTYNTGKNDFPYKNDYEKDNPKEKQKHAEVTLYGILHEMCNKLNQEQVLKTSVWYEKANRNIPPSLDPMYKAYQGSSLLEDETFRSTLQWTYMKNKLTMSAKGAYFYNTEHYKDPIFVTDSRTTSGNAIADLEAKRNIGKNGELFGGINYAFNYANVKDYNGYKQQNQGAGYISYTHNFLPLEWKAELIIRQEIAEGYAAPLTPSLGIEGKLFKYTYLRLHVSQNFRAPTFNDRFWYQPPYSLGNPDLKPEVSKNGEASLVFRTDKSSKVKGEIEATGFYSKIDNMIQWVDQGNFVYMVENLNKVFSRGYELQAKAKKDFKDLHLGIKAGYFYTKSTNDKKINDNDITYKKQIVYIPLQSANSGIEVAYKNIELDYLQIFTGKRYINADNSKSLKQFTLGNVMLIVKHKFGNQMLKLQFDIDNIWNVNYHAIDYYPMPGRAYRVTLNCKI